MGKVSGAIKLLQLLRQNEVMKIHEIQEILNCSGKCVRLYRQALIECGYNIESIRGKRGGYKLIEVNLNESEYLALHEAKKLLSDNPALYNDYINALKKIEYRLFKSI